jgi:hypothetical protein
MHLCDHEANEAHQRCWQLRIASSADKQNKTSSNTPWGALHKRLMIHDIKLKLSLLFKQRSFLRILIYIYAITIILALLFHIAHRAKPSEPNVPHQGSYQRLCIFGAWSRR